MRGNRYRHAAVALLLGLLGAMLTSAPGLAASDCPSGETQFKIDNAPSNGTYGDGTLSVTISNVDNDSFQWSSNIRVSSVMVKGGPVLEPNPGGTSGSAHTADNPNNDGRYGISHVSFCYSEDGEARSEGGPDGDDDECPDGSRMSGNKGCDDGEGDDDGDECAEVAGNGNARGKPMADGCDEDDDDECEEGERRVGSRCVEDADDQCVEGAGTDGSGSREGGPDGGGMDEACEETLADVDENPGDRDDAGAGRLDHGAIPAPQSDDVKGLRIADYGENRGPAARAQVEGRRQESGVLPFTGGPVVPYLVLGFGLVGAGSLMWRRRRES